MFRKIQGFHLAKSSKLGRKKYVEKNQVLGVIFLGLMQSGLNHEQKVSIFFLILIQNILKCGLQVIKPRHDVSNLDENSSGHKSIVTGFMTRSLVI